MVLTAVPVDVKTTTHGLAWVGRIEGVAQGQVVMVVSDGVLAANITVPNGRFHVRFLQDGVYEVQQINATLYPADHPPSIPQAPTNPAVNTQRAPAAQADDGSIIDVMVVYTPRARTDAGGTPAIVNLINLAITETNASYSNSGIAQRVRLVHSTEVAYTEATSDAFSAALNCITNTNDGCLDSIHSVRDTYGADLVSFWIVDDAYCGLGYLNSTASTAFSVVAKDCATGYYSFGHEMGHNMGAHHDAYVQPTTNPAYAHGYTNPAAASPWRTIMAYNNACSAVSKNCTRIPYWSNPAVTYGGAAMGSVSTADNHRVLNSSAYTVANFRASVPVSTLPTAPTIGTAVARNASVDVAFTPGAIGSGTLVKYWATCTNNSVNYFDGSGMGSVITVPGLTNAVTYSCYARTQSTVGYSPWSAASNAVTPAPTVPSAPTGLAVVAYPGSLQVSFAAPDNGGSAISGYTVSCSAAGQTTRTNSGANSPISVSGLTAGVSYTCSVTATNGVGSSSASATVTATPAATATSDVTPVLMLLLLD